MKRTNIFTGRTALVLALIAAFTAISAGSVMAQEKNRKPHTKHSQKAKITIEQAREIALQAAPGKIVGEELEREGKVPFRKQLVYSFDIRNSSGTIMEVWVNARTGKIVHQSGENAEQEAKEKKEDAKKKH